MILEIYFANYLSDSQNLNIVLQSEEIEVVPPRERYGHLVLPIICFLPVGNPNISGKGAVPICKVRNLKKEILKYQTPVLTIDECK